MQNEPILLNDTQMQEFIVNGYVVVETQHPREFHDLIFRKTDTLIENEGNPGNNLLPRVPEIRSVLDDPRVAGALASILGPGYFRQPHRYCHRNPPGSPEQGLHRDGFFTRRHHTRWALLFYYPQDTTAEMGATTIVPRSQYYNERPDRRVGDELSLCGRAGSVVVADFHIWHRATANRSDRTRMMMKFLFARMVEPGAPSWEHAGSEWQPDPADDRAEMWRHMWEWHRGSGLGHANGSRGPVSAGNRDRIAELSAESEWDGFRAAYGLAERGEPEVPSLMSALHDESDAERWHTMHEKINNGGFHRSTTANASYALSAIGGPAVPALNSECGQASPWFRATAVETLGDIGPAAVEALPALGRAVGDESVYVRRHAADALGTVGQGCSSAVPALLRSLADPDLKVRRNATISLCRIGPHAEEAVSGLTAALEDEDRYVRGNAVEALCRIGTRPAVDAACRYLTTMRWCPITTNESPY